MLRPLHLDTQRQPIVQRHTVAGDLYLQSLGTRRQLIAKAITAGMALLLFDFIPYRALLHTCRAACARPRLLALTRAASSAALRTSLCECLSAFPTCGDSGTGGSSAPEPSWPARPSRLEAAAGRRRASMASLVRARALRRSAATASAAEKSNA